VEAVEWSECQNMLQADEALEVERCIRGSGMHRRSTEVDGAARADGARGEYKTSEAVKVVRTCQNWMELVWGYFCCM
jgi:hypothetical protein